MTNKRVIYGSVVLLGIAAFQSSDSLAGMLRPTVAQEVLLGNGLHSVVQESTNILDSIIASSHLQVSN